MANCLLCGVGGQGTVLASKLIAQSAMDRGLMARTAETIAAADNMVSLFIDRNVLFSCKYTENSRHIGNRTRRIFKKVFPPAVATEFFVIL